MIIYVRCCIMELYSITFKFIISEQGQPLTDETFHMIQIKIRLSFYQVFLQCIPIQYRKQSRKLFSISLHEGIAPKECIRILYIDQMKWDEKIVKGLQLSLLSNVIEDHHYDQCITMPLDSNEWNMFIYQKMSLFINDISLYPYNMKL